MKYIEMKSLYTFIKIIFGVIIVILLWMQWDSYNRSLGNGYYIDYDSGNSIKSIRDTNIFIGGILEYKYSNRYIIAKRFPRINYSCSDSVDSYFINKIQYIVIDTTKDIAFGSFDFQPFQNKLNKLGIDLKFQLTDKEINKYIHNHHYWFKKERDRIEYMIEFCKKDIEHLEINKL